MDIVATLNILVVLIYTVCGAGIWWTTMRDAAGESGHLSKLSTSTWLLMVAAGAGLHCVALYLSLLKPEGFNAALGTTFSCAAFVIVLLYLVSNIRRAIFSLGGIALLFAAVVVLITTLWPGPESSMQLNDTTLWWHTLLAVLAYGFLGLAVAQALLLITQDKHLKQKPLPKFTASLPAVEIMESVLFQLVGTGFLLLTMALVLGSKFSSASSGRILPFDHHTILSLIAWVCIAILLIGRWRLGWRGLRAAQWSVASFVLLIMAYFGTRFVAEVVLG